MTSLLPFDDAFLISTANNLSTMIDSLPPGPMQEALNRAFDYIVDDLEERGVEVSSTVTVPKTI